MMTIYPRNLFNLRICSLKSSSSHVCAIAHFHCLPIINNSISVRASGMTTPQPTPAQLSATRSARSLHDITGTSERVSYLRALCLVRDHHRCVISRVFDAQQAIVRMTQYGLNAQDDDGNLIIDGDRGEVLDVAHILPHSLTKVDENLQLVGLPSRNGLSHG